MDLDVECNNSVEMPKAIIDDIIKNDNVYSCESKIEWQANNIAGRVLVPSDMLITELSKKYEKYNYFNSDNKESILRIIASDLAKIFGALKEEMYNADDMFRELIDTNKVVYVNNRCVINDDKYYNAGAFFDTTILFPSNKFIQNIIAKCFIIIKKFLFYNLYIYFDNMSKYDFNKINIRTKKNLTDAIEKYGFETIDNKNQRRVIKYENNKMHD